MIDEDLADQAKREVEAVEESRILLGFLNPEEAVQLQHRSDVLVNPVPPEDEESRYSDNREDYLAVHSEKRSKITPPSAPFRDSDVDVLELPSSREIESHLRDFQNEQHFQEVLENYEGYEWGFGQVPIESIVAFQKSVTKTTYDSIPTSGENGLAEVLQYTLPVGPANMLMPDQIGVQNSEYAGMQFVSRDPNVQVVGPQYNPLQDQPPGTVSVQFLVRSTPNFVQIVHYEDRFILKNGYHRTFQLLRAGESHVPCFIVEVDGWNETGGANPNHFNEDVVMGDRPPLLNDFQSDIAYDLYTAGRNTIIKIVAETSRVRR